MSSYCPFSCWGSGCTRFGNGLGYERGGFTDNCTEAGRISLSMLVIIHFLCVVCCYDYYVSSTLPTSSPCLLPDLLFQSRCWDFLAVVLFIIKGGGDQGDKSQLPVGGAWLGVTSPQLPVY